MRTRIRDLKPLDAHRARRTVPDHEPRPRCHRRLPRPRRPPRRCPPGPRHAPRSTPSPATRPRSARTRASIAVAFDLQQPPTVPEDVTLLINNASTAEFAGPLEASPEAVAREMAINYEGTYATIRAFLPDARGQRRRDRERPLAAEPGQHAADGRLLGLQGRHALAHAGAATRSSERAGQPSTASTRPGSTPRWSPASRHRRPRRARSPRRSSTACENGDEDIFPDPNAQAMSEVWFRDPKAFERAFAAAA